MSIKAYEQLAELCDYPLHLGITEAGGKRTGSIKSSIGVGNLLLRGIPNLTFSGVTREFMLTIRVHYISLNIFFTKTISYLDVQHI